MSTCNCPPLAGVAGTAMAFPVASGMGGMRQEHSLWLWWSGTSPWRGCGSFIVGAVAISVDVSFQSLRWFPVFCGVCSWQIVLPYSGPSRAGSHAPDGRDSILMCSNPALGGPWPSRLSPSVWVGTGACFSTGNQAGDLQSWWFHRCDCSRWTWSWLLPLSMAWSWLTWPLLLPSFSGTSLDVSPCSSLWDCCIWRH